jgi:hypothetical protein
MTSERACDWVGEIAHRLIRQAAQWAPGSLSERLQEEWLADLAAHRGPIAQLRFAFGCCWATQVIAREYYAAAALPASRSPMRLEYFLAYREDDFPFFSNRTITFVMIACLLAGLLCGLAMGLGPQ